MKLLKGIITVLFLVVGINVFAQSGTNPYVGGTHIYFVNSADNGATQEAVHVGNTYKWYLATNEAGDVAATDGDYAVTKVDDADNAWDKSTDVANLFRINITWNAAASGKTYYLFVEEYSANRCISKRRIQINVIPNAFDIKIAAVTADGCNTASGTLFTGNTPDAVQLGSTPRDFNITMTGTVNSWKFKPVVSADKTATVNATYKYNDGTDHTLTVDGDGYIIVPTGVTTVNATASVTNLWIDEDVTITFNIDAGEDVLYGTLESEEAGGAEFAGTATSIVWSVPTTTEIQTN